MSDGARSTDSKPTGVDQESAGSAITNGDGAERLDPLTVDDQRGDEAAPQIDVGVLIAHSPGTNAEPLQSFAEQMTRDGVDELAAATDATWRVHCAEPDPLTDAAPGDRLSSSMRPHFTW